jgi:hypothetical protein
MTCDLAAALEQQQLRGAQHGPDPVPDQMRGNRVAALANSDPGIPIDPGCQRQTSLEHLDRQRPEQVDLESEVLADADRPVLDSAVVIGQVLADQPFVELGHRRHCRDRDQMVAAEPAALTLHPALLMRPLDAGVAVERVETMMRTERDPARRVNEKHLVRTPAKSIHRSAKSTSASAPGSWVCGTNASSAAFPAAAQISGRRFAT